MKYTDAIKLHKGDKVIHKESATSLNVVEVTDDKYHRDCYIKCDDGNVYHHRTLR